MQWQSRNYFRPKAGVMDPPLLLAQIEQLSKLWVCVPTTGYSIYCVYQPQGTASTVCTNHRVQHLLCVATTGYNIHCEHPVNSLVCMPFGLCTFCLVYTLVGAHSGLFKLQFVYALVSFVCTLVHVHFGLCTLWFVYTLVGVHIGLHTLLLVYTGWCTF